MITNRLDEREAAVQSLAVAVEAFVLAWHGDDPTKFRIMFDRSIAPRLQYALEVYKRTTAEIKA